MVNCSRVFYKTSASTFFFQTRLLSPKLSPESHTTMLQHKWSKCTTLHFSGPPLAKQLAGWGGGRARRLGGPRAFSAAIPGLTPTPRPWSLNKHVPPLHMGLAAGNGVAAFSVDHELQRLRPARRQREPRSPPWGGSRAGRRPCSPAGAPASSSAGSRAHGVGAAGRALAPAHREGVGAGPWRRG